jgi:hypothetical protein
MRPLAQIRALFTLIVLASQSPLGFEHSTLGMSVFTGRFTRVAAAQSFDLAQAGVSRCPSRYLRRTTAEACADVSLA